VPRSWTEIFSNSKLIVIRKWPLVFRYETIVFTLKFGLSDWSLDYPQILLTYVACKLYNISLDTLEVKCLAISALLPIVASPSRDLLRLEASSSSGICDRDRRRVSCASSRPPVESVADALRWGPEHKQITFHKLELGPYWKCVFHFREQLQLLKMTVFWDIAPNSLVVIGRRLRGVYCLHHQGDQGPDDGGSSCYTFRLRI
jgi:hypothetical protein